MKNVCYKTTAGFDDSFASPVFVGAQTEIMSGEIRQKSLAAGVEVQIDEGAGLSSFFNEEPIPRGP